MTARAAAALPSARRVLGAVALQYGYQACAASLLSLPVLAALSASGISRFPDPDRLDIRRHPNRHLAFGFGIHTCAGNSLARMEAEVGIGKLLARFATIERAGDFVRGGRARFRGFARYPIRVRL